MSVDFSTKVLIIGNNKVTFLIFILLIITILAILQNQVGKSCLLIRYDNDTFSENTQSTVGIDFRTKVEECIDGTKIKLQLWDTAGQERFRPIIKTFYKSTKACALVFDLTDFKTLQDINYWLKELSSNCSDDLPKILIGNKIDLRNKVKLSKSEITMFQEEIQKIKENNKIQYFECSAKTGQNVQEAFKHLCEEVKNYYDVHKSQFQNQMNNSDLGTESSSDDEFGKQNNQQKNNDIQKKLKDPSNANQNKKQKKNNSLQNQDNNNQPIQLNEKNCKKKKKKSNSCC
ncbi:P-loop containing nucleoside triphosphate hydrolase [Pseudocohnilembus persalinus]|uniref:p-loop containing nucleoside triphosphate hydrolase n=1 Tax=Pseudocohnilembus persalinus TaxID=266149 RepID=A0A0V0QSI0_PSEPJ|nr:P-loop containing nucleoside triphosphate hydrolase [Pseudocohnilembus persalinus]|eukprot:KRX05228.1 P-loop containing nucleoside triphosphate hydrolase [Pseudocohnilembus persalinus]